MKEWKSTLIRNLSSPGSLREGVMRITVVMFKRTTAASAYILEIGSEW